MKIKRCLILFNSFSREHEYLSNIKAILESNFNVSTKIISRYPSSSLIKTGIAFKPNVILTFPFTSEGLSTELHLLKFILKCKIISLRTEGVFNYEDPMSLKWAKGQDNYSKYLVDFEIFWGPKSAKVIGEMLLDSNKITSLKRIKYFGFPKWDIESKIDHELKNIKDYILNNSYDKTLLFVTGFHISNYDNIEIINSAKDIPEDDISRTIRFSNLTKKFKRKLETSINAAAKDCPNTFFIVKIHPLESFEDYSFNANFKNILIIKENKSVNELLSISDYFFHYGSTSAAEAYLLKKPVFYYYDIPLNEYFSDLKWPSSSQILIKNLYEFLINKEYKNFSALTSKKTEEVLKDQFNYIEGEEYKPSFSLAKLISEDTNAQQIPFYDKYFLRSLLKFISKAIKNIFK